MTTDIDAESIQDLQQLADQVTTSDLEPIAPEDAVQMYLSDRKQELRKSSLAAHRSALGFFQDWCAQNGLDNLNNLSGRQLHEYRIWRRDDAPTKVDTLSTETEKTQQDILRQFVKYCETIDAVPTGLHEKVRSPSVSGDEISRSDMVTADQARSILQYLGKYHYASLPHVAWALLANSGPRIGTLVALDVDDYRPNADIPHLRVRHRPETDTPLKNGDGGERRVALESDVCDVLDDYLEHHRPDQRDEHGRKPLLATEHGRISRSTLRAYVYKWTRPCVIGEACPHDRDPDDCDATSSNTASMCPSSRSPHAIRRGYITHELSAGVDRSYISGRCNVSEEVLAEHYDERDEYDRMHVRQRALDEARRDHDGFGGGSGR